LRAFSLGDLVTVCQRDRLGTTSAHPPPEPPHARQHEPDPHDVVDQLASGQPRDIQRDDDHRDQHRTRKYLRVAGAYSASSRAKNV
jgi:hypothetical protein